MITFKVYGKNGMIYDEIYLLDCAKPINQFTAVKGLAVVNRAVL